MNPAREPLPEPTEQDMTEALNGATSIGLLSQAWWTCGADDTKGEVRERLQDVYSEKMRALGALAP